MGGCFVVYQQLAKLYAGLRVHVLEFAGRPVEDVGEILVDLSRVDARQHLRVLDGGLLGFVAGAGDLTLLPHSPAERADARQCARDNHRDQDDAGAPRPSSPARRGVGGIGGRGILRIGNVDIGVL